MRQQNVQVIAALRDSNAPYIDRYAQAETIENMEFDEILTLLIGTAEVNAKPNELIDACNKFDMQEIEYINLYQDHLFNTGYNFMFYAPDNEEGRLEIIEIDGYILQSGIQINYKQKLFFSKFSKHFSSRSYLGAMIPRYKIEKT